MEIIYRSPKPRSGLSLLRPSLAQKLCFYSNVNRVGFPQAGACIALGLGLGLGLGWGFAKVVWYIRIG